MNKLFAFLIASSITVGIASGLLFNQLIVVQNENSELRAGIFDVNAQLEDEQTVAVHLKGRMNELENQLAVIMNKVKIIDFRTNETIFPAIGGMGQYSDLVVTVENFGINDVENLKVIFDGDYFDGYQYHVIYGFNPEGPYKWSLDVGTLKVGESKTVHQIHVIPEDSTFVIQLMMNDVILDEI